LCSIGFNIRFATVKGAEGNRKKGAFILRPAMRFSVRTIFLRLFLLLCTFPPAVPAYAAAPDFERDLVTYGQLTAEQQASLASGKVVRFQRESQGMEGAQAFVLLPASISEVWTLLVDYPTMNTWMHNVKDITQVTWVSPEVAHVGYVIDSPLKDVAYLLERTHTKEQRIRWQRLSGDLQAVYGGYDLFPAAGGTLLHYWSFVDAGLWLPSSVKTFFALSGMQKLMESIRAEAISRHRPRSSRP